MKRKTNVSPDEQAARVGTGQQLASALIAGVRSNNALGKALSAHLSDEWIASLYAKRNAEDARRQFEKCVKEAMDEMMEELYR